MGEAAERFSGEALAGWTAGVFARAGLAEADARAVADALVLANLRGTDTHGVARVPAYLKRIEARLVARCPKMEVHAPFPVSAVLDADNAMGPVAAREALRLCRRAAETFGMGAATVRRSNHFGAASVYTTPLAAEGFIVFALSPAARSLAPFGSAAPLFGTNPFAVAAPAGRYAVWSLDMAASVAARGHVRLAAQTGEPIPEGWALDAEGAPTIDPHRALGGTMLPFAGPKGSGLAMMVDVLGGVLAGSGFAGTVGDWNSDFSRPADVGHFFLVLNIEAFMPRHAFEGRMEEAIERIHALPPAQGFREVLYPGERAGRTHSERLEKGIPLSHAVATALRQIGANFPQPLA